MRFRKLSCAVLAPVLIAGVLVGVTSTTAQARGHYTPKSGPIFNSPISPSVHKRWAIFDQIVNSIRSAPKGSKIRVMSWNIYSHDAVSALIGASNRGVEVRAIMDNYNRVELPNPNWGRLVRGLRQSNARRKHARPGRSVAKLCYHACRAPHGGQAHSKYFLFTHVGRKRHIVMEGGANLTAAAAVNQWNELYTTTRHGAYRYFVGVFNQMWHRRANHANKEYLNKHFSHLSVAFFPFRGKLARRYGDPVGSRLAKVRCAGARYPYGVHGHTVVRAAPDVIRGRRGMRLAHQLKSLYNRRCDVKLTYTVMGKDVWHYLRAHTGRGPLPMKHLVQDLNGDGEFDNYFHVKALTVNGRYGNDRKARFVLQGSSNWSDYATHSDENIGVIYNSYRTLQYQRFITYWFNHQPPVHPYGYSARYARRAHVNPYAHVSMD